MPNLTIAVLGANGYAKDIGKAGTSSDITFYNLKKGEDTVTIIEPTRYPERLAPLYYAVAMSSAALLIVDAITAEFGEMVVMLDAQKITKGYIVLRNYLDISQIAPLIRGTAVEGYAVVEDNPIAMREQLLADAQALTHEQDAAGSAGVVSVDHAFNVKGIGTVVLGGVESGTVRQHDTLTVYPGEMTAQVRSIQKHDDDVTEAYESDRVGLALKNIAAEDLERGMVLTNGSGIKVSDRLEGQAHIVKYWPEPLKEGMVVHIGFWMQYINGRVVSVAAAGDWHSPQLVIELDRELAYLPGGSAVIHYLDGGRLRVAGTIDL